MPSRGGQAALLDIRDNIVLAQSFIGEMSDAEFAADVRTVYAVVRCLEIISEASRRVDETVKATRPDLPWSDMAGAGNVYRHAYEHVREALIYKTVKNALPPLLDVVEAELLRTDQ